MIKNLFFDIHNVITQGNFNDVYQIFAEETGVPVDIVINYHNQNIKSLLMGHISAEQMLVDLGLQEKISPEDFSRIWTKATVKVMSVDVDMVRLLEGLRQKYKLSALTNLTEFRYNADIEMGLYNYFDYLILSHKIGVKKPDKDFFLKALEVTNTKPNEVIFIDDIQINIEIATDLGIQSILFTDYESLVLKLTQFEVG